MALIQWTQATLNTVISAINSRAKIASPTFTGTVSGITKGMVGLGNADNTSDANKPVSTATQTALDLKANLASPTFSGIVTANTFSGTLSGNVTGSSGSCTGNAVTATSAGTATTVTNVPAATSTTFGGLKASLSGTTLTLSN
jgi:hypothetical protein